MKLLRHLITVTVLHQITFGETIQEGMKRQIAESKSHPTMENLMSLAEEIEGYYRHHSLLAPEALAATDEARDELCKIPGHAKYFSDKIERVRRQLEPGPSQAVRWRGDYDRERSLAIMTLRHLPSPETLQVLGQYLSDERDTPPPRRPAQDWTDIPANCILSSEALAKIGLRDGPVSKDGDWESPAALAKIRAWWDEVKSGKRTFSFVGQKVEYRFKPDGTWETLPLANPPDDGPKVSKIAPAAAAAKVATTKPAPTRSWLWVVGVIVLALFGLFRIGAKRTGVNP